MPAYDYTMDPSGFALLSDYVPQALQEIRYFSTYNFVGERVMMRHGFLPYDCEWWHFTLEREPYPDTYFEFPVSSAYLKRRRA